jgi:DNA-binding NtrC family response regulator
MRPRVLIVDHDGYLGRSWRRLLAHQGWHTEQATSLRRGRMLVAGAHHVFDAAVLDVDPQQPADLAHLPAIIRLMRQTTIVLVSAAEGATAKLQLAGRCDALLLKPVLATTLVRTLVDAARGSALPSVAPALRPRPPTGGDPGRTTE